MSNIPKMGHLPTPGVHGTSSINLQLFVADFADFQRVTGFKRLTKRPQETATGRPRVHSVSGAQRAHPRRCTATGGLFICGLFMSWTS